MCRAKNFPCALHARTPFPFFLDLPLAFVTCPCLLLTLPGFRPVFQFDQVVWNSGVQLVHSAFLASAAESFPVSSSILIGFPAPFVILQGIALDRWSVALPDVSPPSGDVACLQRTWDFPRFLQPLIYCVPMPLPKLVFWLCLLKSLGCGLTPSLFFYGPSYG